MLCPFCSLTIAPPVILQTRRIGELPVGTCSCGAAYACDPSGHNQGSAFIESLVFSCNQDWDLAWDLIPGQDYQTGLVEKYDSQNHLVIPGEWYQGRKIAGILSFVRLEKHILEATRDGVEKNLKKAGTISREEYTRVQSPSTPPLTRKKVEEWVTEYQVAALLQASRDQKLFRYLQRFLYSPDECIRYRAAEMMGRASAITTGVNPQTISILLRDLLHSATSPGASCWGAVEAMGEIIAHSPKQFAGYIAPMYTFLAYPQLKTNVIRALARIAESEPRLIKTAAYRIMDCLQDPDPEIRGATVIIFGYMGLTKVVPSLELLQNDPGTMNLYQKGTLKKTSVGQLAREALKQLLAASR